MAKVLIVEDHASMRESLTTALTAAGDFSVVGEVPNADYALDFCRHLHPDLVLMDVCTEGGASGLKAVEESPTSPGPKPPGPTALFIKAAA